MSERKSKSYLPATRKAMDYLARRDHSVKELREKLSRNFESEDIDKALEICQESGWLSDPKELAERVASSLRRRHKSHRYIKHFLDKKGLPRVAFDPEQEIENARHILQNNPRKAQEYKKMYSLLMNRGFDKDTIKKVIHETLRNSPSL